MSSDRVVQITGKPNTCSDCVREVLDLLKTVRFNIFILKFMHLILFEPYRIGFFFRHLLKGKKIHMIPIIMMSIIQMNMVVMVIQLVVVVEE